MAILGPLEKVGSKFSGLPTGESWGLWKPNCGGSGCLASKIEDQAIQHLHRLTLGVYPIRILDLRGEIAVDQGAWRLKGIRMCTSHRLDRRLSNSAFSLFDTYSALPA